MRRGRLSIFGVTMAVVCVVAGGLPSPSQTRMPQRPMAQMASPPRQAPQQATLPAKSTPPQTETPKLRVATRLVQVSVVAHKGGKPFDGLKADDFVVYDNGKPQPIRIFHVERAGEPSRTAKPRDPDTFTNRIEDQESGRPSVSAVLLDMVNTPLASQAYASEQVRQFLKQVQPENRVALYLLGAGLNVLHDFSGDAAALVRALDEYKGDKGQALQEPTIRDASESSIETAGLSEAIWRMEEMRAATRIQLTLSALEAIAGHMGRVSGRKNLVWVSAGFPLRTGPPGSIVGDKDSTQRTGEFSTSTRRAFRAINDANVALYPVDARGLFGNPNLEPWRGAVGNPGKSGLSGGAYLRMQMTLDTMTTLAAATGGRVFLNTNDIAGAMRTAMDDTRIVYVIGFYPDHGQWNGNWRNIRVEAKRENVKLRHRSGYFAAADLKPTKEQVEAELRSAVWSPVESTGLGMTVKASRADGPEGVQLKLEVRLDTGGLRLEFNEGRWRGVADFFYATQGEQGQLLASESEQITFGLISGVYQKAVREGVVMTHTLTIKPGSAKLRVVVREATTGAIGTVTVPVGKYFSTKAQ